MNDYHGFSSQEAYQAAKEAERDKIESKRREPRSLYADEIVVCGHCRAERRARAAKARKAKDAAP